MLIGLTGGIASGKSSVSAILKRIGHPLIDADQIARDVVEPGEVAFDKIVSHFGKAILKEDGTIARKRLGAVVFNDEAEREVLNKIVHPAVRTRMNEQKEDYLRQGFETIIFDIPLLYESNLFHLVDKVMLVYVNKHVQLERLLNRDKSKKDEALKRIHSQLDLEEKRMRADSVIDNNGSLEETEKQVLRTLDEWDIKPPN
ncbi:dephospho-CoA kinase [Bacillus solitudinis]|uniref:dephospho-CoA kinase n=1 Tax=Bacillus solitudinis TaxID=2014074 RepID=UPI000C234535|nr:dephospho-CoA kinase [Bacillus solitudinis]